MKNSLTIWGCGFVGAAAYLNFKGLDEWPIKNSKWSIKAYDKNQGGCLLDEYRTINSPLRFVDEQEALQSELHFVCVPTPMLETGECYTGIVESVISTIHAANPDCDIVIKSTVPAGFTKSMAKIHERIYFNPEFLTEANFLADFRELPYQFIGCPGKTPSYLLMDLYKDAKTDCGVQGGNALILIDSTEAEMIKLTRNCYLATRLSFFNEIKQICDKMGVNYDSMRKHAGLDERVGSHYSMVPGPDGKPGWSLSCLPKDINDLMHLAKSAGVDPKVLSAVWEKNLEVRPERDWENLSKAVKKS